MMMRTRMGKKSAAGMALVLSIVLAASAAWAQDAAAGSPANGSPANAQDSATTDTVGGMGYWKNHDWGEGTSVTILGVAVDETLGKEILWGARANNFSMLFAQLVTAKLNVNASSTIVIPAIDEAEAFLQSVETEYGDVVIEEDGGGLTLNWDREFDTKDQKREATSFLGALMHFNAEAAPTEPAIHSKGYWKNHSWDGAVVLILGVEIDETLGQEILSGARGNDFSMLFAQLIAAKLNTNASSAVVVPEIQAADDFLQSVEDEYGDVALEDGSLNWDRPFDTKDQKQEAVALWEALDEFNNLAAVEMIEGFYRRALGRESEAGAVTTWRKGYFEYSVEFDIDVRFVPREMGRLFFLSEEYRNRNRANGEFITDCYETFLERLPGQSELNGWLSGVWNRAQVMTIFAESEEFAARVEAMHPDLKGNSTRNFVTMMYIGLLDRLVDQGGLDYFAGLFEQTADVRALAKWMARAVIASEEFQAKGPTTEDCVVRLYRAFLGRFPNDTEIAYWTS
ncbi:MAG TPA: DUF4214 domain-containing protein, partial [Sumerlaeia bacterium]|nr:DUF4214 domain-containing protein [Sumerlaeia bacterium]